MSKSSLIAACVLGAAALFAQAASADDAKQAARKAKPATPTAGCTQQTGSRIPHKDGCAGVGRSYGGDDIRRTGATTTGGALRLMDPSISGH